MQSKFWALFDAKGSVEDGKTAGRGLKKSEMIVKFFINFLPWAGDLKNSRKYDSGLSCCWALFKARAFEFKLHLFFNRI